MIIRSADLRDLPEITEIYNEAILHSTATFDTIPKTLEDRRQWLMQHDRKHPVLVASDGDKVLGWGSLTCWSDRCAYSGTVENSIYVAEFARKRGVGKALLEALVKSAREAGHRTIIARITDGNTVSVRMHEQLGFVQIGVMQKVGLKFERLLDVYLMQKML